MGKYIYVLNYKNQTNVFCRWPKYISHPNCWKADGRWPTPNGIPYKLFADRFSSSDFLLMQSMKGRDVKHWKPRRIHVSNKTYKDFSPSIIKCGVEP